MQLPPPADTTNLFLVRHGATDANLQRPYILQGQGINGPLSTLGEKQAAACSRLLSELPISHIYASPMLRAQQTAVKIAQPHGLTVQTARQLNECDVGRWEGLDWGSIERDFPDEYTHFRKNPAEHPYAGGESYGDVAQRVRPQISELLKRHRGESIVIVGHNVVNRVYLASLLDLPLTSAPSIRQANCGVNIIRSTAEETMLTTMNALFHLNGLLV